MAYIPSNLSLSQVLKTKSLTSLHILTEMANLRKRKPQKTQKQNTKISRGQAQCKLKKASVFSLDCTFHSFCLTAQYKLLS